MRPELTGCIQLPTGTVKLELTPATQALIWRCHFSPLAFVFLSPSLFFSLPLLTQSLPLFTPVFFFSLSLKVKLNSRVGKIQRSTPPLIFVMFEH